MENYTGASADKQKRQLGEHAIVLGGGIAGLLTSYVLKDAFQKVTLVERDCYSEFPEAREGTPQSQHVHLLLAKGVQLLEQMFPGLEKELMNHGASIIDFTRDVIALMPFGWLPRFYTGIHVYGCSRKLLEWAIRERVRQAKNLILLQGCCVSAYEPDADNMGLCGVRIKSTGPQTDAEEMNLSGDFFVDAMGRTSKTPRILNSLGFGETPVEKIDPFLGYATQQFQPPSNRVFDWKLLSSEPMVPLQKQGGTIIEIENGNWLALMVGTNHMATPVDDHDFIEFSKGLATPLLHRALKDAKPISPVYRFRNTANRFRRFDKMKCWPKRFIAIGDSVCSMNPLYGQGVTACTLGVQILQQEISRMQTRKSGNLLGFSKRFQKKLAKIYSVPWLMATSEDLRWPETENSNGNGKQGIAEKLMIRYMNALLSLVPEQPEVAKCFFEVVHMLKPPYTLFHPKIIARVLLTPARRCAVDATFLRPPEKYAKTLTKEGKFQVDP